jgi:hypothetical protein
MKEGLFSVFARHLLVVAGRWRLVGFVPESSHREIPVFITTIL